MDPRRLEQELWKRLAEWRRLLEEHTPIARQMVLKLVDGRIVFAPKPERSEHEVNGRTVLDKVLAGLIGPEMDQEILARPAGLEPATSWFVA